MGGWSSNLLLNVLFILLSIYLIFLFSSYYFVKSITTKIILSGLKILQD